MQGLSDEELVAKFRAETETPGDRWMNELFQRYHARVATWCLRFTGDRESAADLAQDIFLKAYRNLNSFRGDAKFSTWLFSIARNHCVNEMKSRSVRPEDSTDAQELDLTQAADGHDVLTELERRESLRSMQTLIAETLDETEARVMTMHYADDITLDAVTRLLGLTNSSGAKAYVVSAKRKLGAALRRLKAREK